MRKLLLDELRKMMNKESGFISATGERVYFDLRQDLTGSYDLVNLNVCLKIFKDLSSHKQSTIEILKRGKLLDDPLLSVL